MTEEQARRKLIERHGAAWWHNVNTFFPGERERAVRELMSTPKSFEEQKPYVPLPPWRKQR